MSGNFYNKNDGSFQKHNFLEGPPIRYSSEDMISLFRFYPYPPKELQRYCEIISPLGSQKPALINTYTELERKSYLKGVNSYLALIEKYPQFRSKGRGRRSRGGRGPNRNFDNWDKRCANGPVHNGVGPPGQWDHQWTTGGGPRQRWSSGTSNASEHSTHSYHGRSDWVRGGVWTRGGRGRANGHNGYGDRQHHLDVPAVRNDGRLSPTRSGSQNNLDHEVEEIWEDDWDLELIGDTPASEFDPEDHDEEWSRILSHASLYDLRDDGADSPAAWSECPIRSNASPPRSLCLEPPILQRLVRQELLRSPSQSGITPEVLQEMVENVITQLPVIAQDEGVSPMTPSQALELTEANRRLEEELRKRENLLMEQQKHLKVKEEELEEERRKHLRAWDNGPPHRKHNNRPKSLVEIQWEQAADESRTTPTGQRTWAEHAAGVNANFLSVNMTGNVDSNKTLTRHCSLDVLNNRVDPTDSDAVGWIQRKGRRRRVFRRVDLNNFNTILKASP